MGASRLLTFDTTSALLISSGRDWTDRTKHIAARAPVEKLLLNRLWVFRRHFQSTPNR
jgi:hypothetical protein